MVAEMQKCQQRKRTDDSYAYQLLSNNTLENMLKENKTNLTYEP